MRLESDESPRRPLQEPIIFGLGLYDSFDKQRKKGLVPVPSPKEAARESHAGHSMLCVGYFEPPSAPRRGSRAALRS